MKKLFGFLLFVSCISSSALADQILEKKSKIMGKEFSVRQELGSSSSGTGVRASTSAKFLGKSVPLLSASMEYSVADGKIDSKANDLYVNGIKVWTGSGTISNGSVSYSGSVAPTQIEMPVFSYTVGPLALQVNGGVQFEAAMDAKLSSPVLASVIGAMKSPSRSVASIRELPVNLAGVVDQKTLVDASLDTNATASGYVEGLARVILVQVGLGGNVNIVDGNASVAASIPLLEPANATFVYDGKLQVLNGSIYAFIDYRKLGGWKRWKNFNLYSWNGYCWSMGNQSCAAIN